MNNQEEKKESLTPIYTTIKNSKDGDIPVTIYDKSNEPTECPPSVAEQIQKRKKRAEFWGVSPERIGELNFLAEYAVRQCVVSAARRPDNSLCQYDIPEKEPGMMSESDRELLEQMKREEELEKEYMLSIKRPNTATEYGYYYREIVKGLEKEYKIIAKGYYSGLDYLYSVEPFRDYDLTIGELFPDELLPNLIEKQIAKKDKVLRELEPIASKVPELREHIADLRAERDRLLVALTQSQKEIEHQKATGETAERRIQKASIALDQKRKEIQIPIFKAASIIADEAKELKIHHYCQRGAYISISANERNIKNWEAKRNPCPWPDGFPNRLLPEKDFRIYVRRGLEGYLDRIREGRREREEKKMKENLENFNGISLDNPSERDKARIAQIDIDSSVDRDGNPSFIYYDEKDKENDDEVYNEEFQERIDRTYNELMSKEEDDENTDDDGFDDE